MKDSKMHRHIDQLLFEGREEEAIPLIEEVRRKRAQEQKDKQKDMLASIARRIDALKKDLGMKE